MQLLTFPVILEESFMISPKVKHFRFKYEPNNPFNFIPGQFITIHFEHQGKKLKRSYSLANQPNDKNFIEFAAGYFEGGPGTELLFNLKPGDTLNINGPFGRLILKEMLPRRYIFVATSTGITPYRAMLAELGKRMENNPELKVVILQGIQKRQDVLYAEDFHQFVKTYPQAEFIVCLSRETEPLQPFEFKGYAQHAFVKLDLKPEEDIVYLCGNPGMIDDAFQSLKEQGFAMQQIIREKYISS